MRNSTLRSVAAMATLFFASYLIAFLITRHSVTLRHGQDMHAPARAAVPEPAPMPEPEYALTADRITLGSGIEPDPPAGPLAAIDAMIRQMVAMPDGPEKMQLAGEIGAIRDRAAAPILLDWAVVTTDRAVLRSALEALGPLADAGLVADITSRFAAAYRADDRYRLGRVVRNITAPDAVPALMDLANDPSAPPILAVAATEALATIATPPAVSLLLAKIEEVPADDIQRLVTAISRIDSAQALSTLRYAAVGNKDASSDRARVAAIQALGNFPDDETRRLLRNLGADNSGLVRNAALAVLARVR
jgi:hypothetical protein